VTVLFADLVGFTARAEQLDPEDVEAILRPYHERLRAELERFGGTVEKFIGDAVMALFGAPVAHEDDPERAVRAALAIRDWTREQAGVQVRIAVNDSTSSSTHSSGRGRSTRRNSLRSSVSRASARAVWSPSFSSTSSRSPTSSTGGTVARCPMARASRSGHSETWSRPRRGSTRATCPKRSSGSCTKRSRSTPRSRKLAGWRRSSVPLSD